ncbi:MAG: ABC transporter ATP-binding protein, partial [Sciscionella sp.]
DRAVLQDVSLTAMPGTSTAIIGSTGSGKSTLVALICRLYDATTGAVRVGDVDVRDRDIEELWSTIGLVPQRGYLFSGTVADNLLYGKADATEDEMWAALDAAQVGRLVRQLDHGLDTLVGERGYRLSGGEKQRLAIARLLLKGPRVVVLDEATAHLDSESEHLVQRALATALEGRTSLVIAHRLSTVRDADSILVIEDGRIAEHGTHDQLLGLGGLYADLYRTQFATQAATV